MRGRGLSGFAAGGLIAGAVLWSVATTDVEVSRLFSAGPRIGDFLGRMYPPDPSVMKEIVKGSAETLRIAILGTLGAVLLSVPLGILASATMAPTAVHRTVRTLLALIRAIPLILVAMLMVGAVGLGPLPWIKSRSALGTTSSDTPTSTAMALPHRRHAEGGRHDEGCLGCERDGDVLVDDGHRAARMGDHGNGSGFRAAKI